MPIGPAAPAAERSVGVGPLEQARAALRAIQSVQARMDPNYSEPVRFISSEGEVRPLEVDMTAEPTATPDE